MRYLMLVCVDPHTDLKQVGGFDVIECRDRDEAVEAAADLHLLPSGLALGGPRGADRTGQ